MRILSKARKSEGREFLFPAALIASNDRTCWIIPVLLGSTEEYDPSGWIRFYWDLFTSAPEIFRRITKQRRSCASRSLSISLSRALDLALGG